ncbi:restriction endonuclease subunit S [candidate division WOR-3 bacterium]|nr:restriction endonuclease subunit S [candidate division WOR-3 bacterium]
MPNNKNNLPNLPKGWVWTKLIDTCQYVSTGVEKYNREIEYYSTGSIKKTSYVPEEVYSFSKRPSRANRMSKTGDVLQARMAGTNKALLIQERLDGKLFSTGFIQLRPFDFCNGMSSYIYYYVQSYNFLSQRDKLATGSTQVALTDSGARQITFPFPPLPEQHRIVEKIEEVFTKLGTGVKALKNIKLQLKRYRQAVLKYAFEGKLTEGWRKNVGATLAVAQNKGQGQALPLQKDLSELPDGWEWTRVGEVADKIHYGYTAKATTNQTGPKLLRITDIQNDSVNWDTVPFCKIDEAGKHKYLLEKGNLVFARTGATVGKSFLISGEIPEAVFASYLIRIILNNNVNKNFVYNFFHSNHYWLQIYKGQLGIGQPNVNAQILSRLTLPLPPLTEQYKIVEEIEYRFSVADEVEKVVDQSFKQAERLRQSILKKAFEGKLVPQDPTDEPAEKLLERIKTEKAKLEIEKKKNKKDYNHRLHRFSQK